MKTNARLSKTWGVLVLSNFVSGFSNFSITVISMGSRDSKYIFVNKFS